MNNWFVTCPNDGFRLEVMADTKEDAAKTALASPEFMNHEKTHPEMAGKSAEEMLTMIMGMIEMSI